MKCPRLLISRFPTTKNNHSTRSFVDASRAFLNESNRPDPNRASRHRVEARDVDVPSVARSFVHPLVSFTRERAPTGRRLAPAELEVAHAREAHRDAVEGYRSSAPPVDRAAHARVRPRAFERVNERPPTSERASTTRRTLGTNARYETTRLCIVSRESFGT